MAGSLIKIDEEIVTSAVASVTLGGSDWDSSYDVYMVRVSNAKPVNDNQLFITRVTKDVSGTPTPQTTANYDYAAKFLDSTTTFGNQSGTNVTYWQTHTNIGNSTSEMANGIYYLFNFNNASEYSFMTKENTDLAFTGALIGHQGGGVYTVAEAHNGITMLFGTGNISAGTFTLYGLAK